MIYNDALVVEQETATWPQTHYRDTDHLVAREPMTAEQLLRRCVDLLSKPCNRPRCRYGRDERRENERLQAELNKMTAERDALERILARRQSGMYA